MNSKELSLFQLCDQYFNKCSSSTTDFGKETHETSSFKLYHLFVRMKNELRNNIIFFDVFELVANVIYTEKKKQDLGSLLVYHKSIE
jgi:hypothetical protein